MKVRLTSLSVAAEADLIHHVMNFLLSRVITHSTHQVWQLLHWHASLELASLSCVFLLRADHRVVEEIVDVLVSLTFSTALNELDERLSVVTTKGNGLLDG